MVYLLILLGNLAFAGEIEFSCAEVIGEFKECDGIVGTRLMRFYHATLTEKACPGADKKTLNFIDTVDFKAFCELIKPGKSRKQAYDRCKVSMTEIYKRTFEKAHQECQI